MSSLNLIGLSHRRAPIELRERVTLTDAEAAELSRRLASDDGEVVCLSTCNRTEIYSAGRDNSEALLLLSERSGLAADELADVAYRLHDDDVALHLYRVAAGLDSLVPGEGQILGQVRSAFDSGATGPLLDRMFRGAIHAGRRGAARDCDRRGSGFGGSCRRGARRAALRRSRPSCSVMLLGAGKTGELAAASLVARGARIELVANRSPAKAREVAARYGGSPVALAEAAGRLADADVVVSSTSARGFVLARADVEPTMRGRKGRPLFFIDIAVPRDVDPAVHELDGCYVYDIDDLETVVTDSTPGPRGGGCAGGGDRGRRGRAVRGLARVARRGSCHCRSTGAGGGDSHAGARARAWAPGQADGRGAQRGGVHTGGSSTSCSTCRCCGSRRRRPATSTTMLLRVGTRGSRLALTQAGLAADLLRAAGRRGGARPDHDDRRPRPAAAVRRDRRARGLREGARGSVAGRPHRRRRPLREGHDFHGHGGARRRRLSRARGSAGRARRSGRVSLPACAWGQRPPPPGAAARDRAVAVDRAAAGEHRHAPAQALRARSRRDRARRLRARPPRARRRRSATASSQRKCSRKRARAPSHFRCARARRTLVAAVDHAETRRRVEPERACVAEIGGGCLAPVAAYHDGEQLEALIADEDGSWIERRRDDDPVELARELVSASKARATA